MEKVTTHLVPKPTPCKTVTVNTGANIKNTEMTHMATSDPITSHPFMITGRGVGQRPRLQRQESS